MMLTCSPTGLSVEGDDDSLGSFLRLIMRSSWLTLPQGQSSIMIPRGNGCTVEDIYHSNLNFDFLGMVVKGVSPGAESVESDLFAIATVFLALQNITIIFLPPMAIIHRLPTIFSFLMIPKLNLVIGIFFAQTSGRLTDVVSRCISLPLWSLIGARRCSFLQYYMLAPVCGCDFLSPSFPASFHLTNMLIG